MATIGRIFGGIVDALIAVFGGLSLGSSLFWISLLLGIGMLYIFKFIGDPNALEQGKNRMQAHIMEMRLFDREPLLVFQAIGRLFYWNFKFMFATLRPMIIATLPMVFLFIQLDHYYGMRPLRPGESAVVTARVDDARALEGNAVELLGDNEYVRVETPPMRRAKAATVSWRVRGIKEGRGLIQLQVGEQKQLKTVNVGRSPRRRISTLRGQRLGDQILYPVEPPLEPGPVSWIRVTYPAISVSMFWVATHWLVWLSVVSLFGSLLVRWLINQVRPGTL